MKSFQQTQYIFTAHLRDPQQFPPPVDIEDRRLAIYRDLIFNNIEHFIAGAFPVLRSLMDDVSWLALVRGFVARHRAQTPYFLEISQEFLAYLLHERGLQETDPPFLIELAHYEWVELALDVAHVELPDAGDFPPANLLRAKPRVSPLVMNLLYQFPVHKISPDFQPTQEQQTYLLVYRNRLDQVKFMESNALTQRLLCLLQSTPDACLRDVLQQIAAELNHANPEELFTAGEELIRKLFGLHLVSHIE